MAAFGHTLVPFMGLLRLRVRRASADRADVLSGIAVGLAAIAIPRPTIPPETLLPVIIAHLPRSLSAPVIVVRAGVAPVLCLIHSLLVRNRVFHVRALLSHPTKLLTTTMGRVVLTKAFGAPVNAL